VSSTHDHVEEYLLTKADAVGPSRIANSSFVKDMRGIISVRIGKSSMMRTGKPIAAEKKKKKKI
jgi:hypothetical protein